MQAFSTPRKNAHECINSQANMTRKQKGKRETEKKRNGERVAQTTNTLGFTTNNKHSGLHNEQQNSGVEVGGGVLV
jgi:hypothetical protein